MDAVAASSVFVWVARLVRYGVVPTACVMALSLLPFVPAQAAPKPSPGAVVGDRSVPVSAVKPKKLATPAMELFEPEPVSWPSAGSAVVELPLAADRSRRLPARVTVGGLPVTVAPAGSMSGGSVQGAAGDAATPPRVAVQVLDRATVQRAGFPLAVKVARADGRSEAARVRLEVNYSAFRHAYGADWDSRLQLVLLPECGLTRAGTAGCAEVRPLPTANDYRAGVLRAEVEVTPDLPVLSQKEATAAGLDRSAYLSAAETMVVALSSTGSSSDTGDFSKTDLSASSQWAAGDSSGDFTWSYPITPAPVPGGLEPEVSLTYDSGSVDGRTAGANVQPSWLGEGWNYTPGFIERSYRPCRDDTEPTTPYWTAANGVPDACWRLNNARIFWDGRSTEIILGDDGVWRLADDDRSKVELLSDTGSDITLNWHNERWRLTTTDGTQYYFGQSLVPGTTVRTNSVLGQRVVSNHTGEPCFTTSSLSESNCAMAYRWYLDYVVDAHGNSMLFYYTKETNFQRLIGTSTVIRSYDRAAHLNRIEYGLRAGSEATTTAPARIVFTTGDRCLTASCGTHDKANWPDTPWDLACSAAPCGPASFWSTKRLTRIESQIWSGSGTTYHTVDQWDLRHQFPSTGNGTSPALWLGWITHTGKANGGSIALPSISAGGVRLDQRADYDPNGTMAQPRKWRIAQLNTETGGQIQIAYEATDPGCAFGSPFPDPDNNTKRCFPQYYYPQLAPEGWSWWHKYIVKSVTEKDLVGGSPDVVHSYSYSTAGSSTPVLWGHDDGAATWSSVLAKRSWADWRGYSTVTVTTGPAGGPQTQTKYLYFRGLDKDFTDTGENRAATITNSVGDVLTDDRQRAGLLHEEIEYASPGGQALTKTISTPVSYQTGQRVLSSDWAIPATQTSYLNRTAQESTYTWVAATGSWRTTRVTNTWDTSSGLLTQVDDAGDTTTTDDDICTTYTYARNTTVNLRRFDGTGPSAINLLPRVLVADWSGYDLTFPAGDFNGDGKTDLIARRPADGSLWLIPGNGAGGYNAAVKIGNSGWNAFQDIFSPGDMTGDGKPDVVVSKPDSTLWRYDNATNLSNPTQINGKGWQPYDLFSPGDFTGDGKGDVLGRHTNGTLFMWPGTGAGNFGAGVQIGTGGWDAYRQAFGWGDITGDGKTDFMAADQIGIWLYVGNGSGGYAPRVRLATGLIGLDSDWFVATGDITGDGNADLLAHQHRYLASPLASEHTEGVSCPATPTFPADALADTRYYHDQPGATNPALSALPVIGDVTRTEEADKYTGSTPHWITTGEATYDRWGRPTAVTDALGRTTTTTYTHGANGLLASYTTTNPALHQTTTTVDPAWGLPTTETDPNGKVTTAAYDALGRLTKVWLPGRPTNGTGNQEYVYSVTKTAPTFVQSKVLGPNGNQISSFDIYDGLLRLRQTQTTAPDGKRVIIDTRYDPRGLPAADSAFYNSDSAPTGTLVSFADADVTTQHRITYDQLERPVVDGLWSHNSLMWQTTTSYDGDRVSVDPPDGGTPTTTITDARGRTVALRQYLGSSPAGAYDQTSYGYDRLDRLTTVTDPAGNRWTNAYDLRGQLTAKADPDVGTTTFTYDNAGQLLTSTDARGETLFYAYDSMGRQTELRDDNATGTLRASWTYDTLAKGYPTSATRHDSTGDYVQQVTGYTDLYQPTGLTTTIPASQGALAGTYTTDLTYHPDGSLATTSYQAKAGLPAETVTHTYTDHGYLTSVTGLDTYLASAQYYWRGGVKQQILGSGTTRARFTTTIDDATGRLTDYRVETENQTTPNTWDEKLTEQYTYDPAGNITSIAETTSGAIVANQCFRYDYLRRLTEAWTTTATTCQTTPSQTIVGGADPYWHSYTYDKTGNRTSDTRHTPEADTTRTYTYPSPGTARPHALTSITTNGGGPTTTYTYDNGGHQKTRTSTGKPDQNLTWDAEGHLTQLANGTTTHTYIYDADGNRLIADNPDTEKTLYLDHTEYHLSHTTGQVTATRYYPNAVRTTTNGLTWTAADHHGTNQLAIHATTLTTTRRRLTPFGETRGDPPTTWPDDKGFVGGTTDPTGYTHLGAREYDPPLSRFISIDRVIDVDDPQQMNGYAYANNNPTTFSDPTGMIPADCREFDCYGYDVKKGCPHGCGSTDNVKWGKKNHKSSTRANERKAKRTNNANASVANTRRGGEENGRNRNSRRSPSPSPGPTPTVPGPSAPTYDYCQGACIGMAKGGRQNIRDSGLRDVSDDELKELERKAKGAEKRRYQKELKARGLKHTGGSDSRPKPRPMPTPPSDDDGVAANDGLQRAVTAAGAGIGGGVLLWWLAKILSPLCGPLAPACAVAL